MPIGKGLICPHASGPEAAWAGADIDILAPRSLIAIANHFRGTQVLSRPEANVYRPASNLPDLADIKGQETAKRALEVAAAGGHNLLMVGPPGSGKSMLAQRLPSILPPLPPKELLEVSMIASIAGELAEGKLSDRRPFRAPHHSASMAAMVGGGLRVKPGEVSLAHCGVLFLDELPEFHPAGARFAAPAAGDRRGDDRPRQPPRHLSGALPARRRDEPVPLRHGRRAGLPLRARHALPDRLPGAHLRAAPRPHRSPDRRAGGVGRRPDPPGARRAERVRRRSAWRGRARSSASASTGSGLSGSTVNAHCPTALIEEIAAPDAAGLALLREASEKIGLSARAYHRVLKVARTLADLDGADTVGRIHLAEAISYRITGERLAQAAGADGR